MGKKPVNLEKQKATMERSGDAGWKALQRGNFARAEEAYAKAVNLARSVEDHGAEAVFLSYLGIAKQSQQRLEEAIQDFEEAIVVATNYGLAKVEAHGRLLLAEQARDQGKTDQAIHQFILALDAAYNCGDVVGMEIALGNLGRLYLERGWAEQSFECFRNALEVRPDTPNRITWLGSMGLAQAELGQYEEAVSQYLNAYEEASTAGDASAQAICKGSQGNVFFECQRLQEASECYEEALKLSQEAGDGRRVAIWLGNIGNTWLKLGDLNKAIEACTNAVELARTHGDRQSEAAHLDSLGDCYFAQGNLNAALDRYNEALAISKNIEDRLGQRIYLSNLGKVHQQMGQLQPAFDFFVSAIDLFDEQRATIKADDLKTSFANRGQELYRDMVKVCLAMGRRVEALEYVGRAKSRALLDLLSNSPIDISQLSQESDESLQKLIKRESELRSQIGHLERLFWQGPPAQESGMRGAAIQPEESQKIYGEWRDVVNQLRMRHPNYASLVTASTLTFDQVSSLWDTTAGAGGSGGGEPPAEAAGRTAATKRRTQRGGTARGAARGGGTSDGGIKSQAAAGTTRYLLSRNTAILEFYWTDQYLFSASVWHGASEPQINFINKPEDIETLNADLTSFLEMAATEGWEVPASLCRRLYDKLLRPILSDLPDNIDRLLLVPHGSLYHLPFSALNDGSQFLCQRYALSYLPTTSLIPVLARDTEPALQEETRYLVSAISDYSATRKDGLVLSSRLRSAAGLDDLTYTMEEAETIFNVGSKNAKNARLLTNQEVKDALPTLFGQYPVVHFAGHAVFNPEEPLASGLVLSDGSILTAAAILQGNVLRTRCGKLLVLSACQTGVNMVTPGGEILGLARALMYAGMPNLVLSLWEVADRSTASLMEDFHSLWRAGATTIADALRSAQRNALAKGQPVHAWAPFIHLGIE